MAQIAVALISLLVTVIALLPIVLQILRQYLIANKISLAVHKSYVDAFHLSVNWMIASACVCAGTVIVWLISLFTLDGPIYQIMAAFSAASLCAVGFALFRLGWSAIRIVRRASD